MSWEETTGSHEQDKYFIAGLCESEETLSFIDSLVLTAGEGCVEFPLTLQEIFKIILPRL